MVNFQLRPPYLRENAHVATETQSRSLAIKCCCSPRVNIYACNLSMFVRHLLYIIMGILVPEAEVVVTRVVTSLSRPFVTNNSYELSLCFNPKFRGMIKTV